jgi:hypothetical protein
MARIIKRIRRTLHQEDLMMLLLGCREKSVISIEIEIEDSTEIERNGNAVSTVSRVTRERGRSSSSLSTPPFFHVE